MKRTIILLLSFCWVLLSHSQQTPSRPGPPSCEEGIKRAKADANNGKYISYSYGLIARSTEEWRFHEFYAKYMKQRYGILLEEGGCVITTESECYSRTMHKLIKAKFGADIFEISRADARALYLKQED